MAARRLLILMLVLLITSTIAAALVPPQAEREQETTETTRPQPRDENERAGRSRLIEATVAAERRRSPRTIAMRVGDELELTVRAEAADQVEIPALGRLSFVGPGSPARFYLFGERSGVFEVRLLEAERTIARIRVREAQPESSRPESSRPESSRRESSRR